MYVVYAIDPQTGDPTDVDESTSVGIAKEIAQRFSENESAETVVVSCREDDTVREVARYRNGEEVKSL